MSHSRAALNTELLTAYLEGELSRAELSWIEARLEESPEARRQLAGLRNIKDALCQPAPELEAVDLVPSLRQAVTTLDRRSTPRRMKPWHRAQLWSVAAGIALVAGTAWIYRHPTLIVASRRPITETASLEEFRAKSADSDAAKPSRWAGIRLYHLGPGNNPERLSAAISAEDGLLFSYTNLGKSPFSYLMIFAVDTRMQVRWLYPAYEQIGANPASISIEHGRADVALPDLVHLDWGPGPIAIHALFSARPLRVLEVEAKIRRVGNARGAREPLTMSDAIDQVTTTEIVQ